MKKALPTNSKSNTRISFPVGIVPLIFFCWMAWSFKPVFFYKQKESVVVDIKDSIRETYIRRKLRSNKPTTYLFDIYIFNIDGKEIQITKWDNNNYDYLVGEKIKYRSYIDKYESELRTWSEVEEFYEIVYNDNVVYSKYDFKWFMIYLAGIVLSIFLIFWEIKKKWFKE